jgi:MFS superfamily sulfate permease-like transporter
MFFAGAMHFISGLTFGIPMPVQPMKSIAAIAIAEGLDEATILAAGIGAGLVLLLLALTGLIDRIGRILPRSIVRGLQLAIGLKLLMKGVSLITESGSWLAADSVITGLAGFILIMTTLKVKKFPGAPVVVFAGLGLMFLTQPTIFSRLSLGWELPTLQVITQADFITGFWRGTLPQIPLTILNSVIAVSVLSTDLFPLRPLKPRKVTFSVALMNLIACPLGGMPMCHGAGGLAAQYRFGARTGGSVVFLGTAKMLLAVLFGSSLLVIFTEFPASLLGVLLIFSGLELAAVCRDQTKRQDFFVMILTAGVSITVNVAIGFTAGTLVALMIYRQRMLPAKKKIIDKESPGLLRKVPSYEK